MLERLTTPSILEYQDAIYEFAYDVENEGLPVNSVPFEVLLRPFRFWDDFQDITCAMIACMPVFGGYILANGGKEEDRFTRDEVKKTLDIAGAILDGRPFSISEWQDPAELLKLPYDFTEKAGAIGNLLSVTSLIEEQEAHLQAIEEPGIAELMKLGTMERVERYTEVIQSISTCKNCVYNIVRNSGDQLLGEIEAHIDSLIPADQSFVLHGLDAFPKHEKIIAFLESFIEKHPGEWIAEEAGKYLERVRSGTETTGWE